MPIQMTPGQARVVDPVLTTVAQGYRNSEFVGFSLFPAVPVDLRGGQVIQFGKEAFKLYNTRRAPGGKIKRLQVGYAGIPYALESHALAAVVPFEIQDEAKMYPGIDVTSRSVGTVMKSTLLELEVQMAGIAQNPANYDSNHKVALSGSDMWTDPSSDPITAFDDYREAVRTSTGVYPNVANFSPSDWKAFKNNPNVKDNIKYTEKAIITPQLAAAMLEIETVNVGKAIYSDDQGNFVDVWGGGTVLAYTDLGSLDAEAPSYGYTYRLRGNPAVKQPWYDDDSGSWIYPVMDERLAVPTGLLAGFLIQGAS